MELHDNADQLAKRIDKIDQENELSLEQEQILGVDREEEITSKVKVLEAKTTLFGDDQKGNAAKENFKTQISDLLEQKNKELDELQIATDLQLSDLVSKTLDELDAMLEAWEAPGQEKEREALVKKFAEEVPVLRPLVERELQSDRDYEKGGKGYYLYLVLNGLQQYESINPDYNYKQGREACIGQFT